MDEVPRRPEGQTDARSSNSLTASLLGLDRTKSGHKNSTGSSRSNSEIAINAHVGGTLKRGLDEDEERINSEVPERQKR